MTVLITILTQDFLNVKILRLSLGEKHVISYKEYPITWEWIILEPKNCRVFFTLVSRPGDEKTLCDEFKLICKPKIHSYSKFHKDPLFS